MAKIFELQSSNYVELQGVASGAIVAGALVVLGSTVNAFTMIDVATGEQYTAIKSAEKVKCPKAAVAIAAGEPVYLDVSESLVTNVATDNTLVGYCQLGVSADDTVMYIEFDGTAEYLKA